MKRLPLLVVLLAVVLAQPAWAAAQFQSCATGHLAGPTVSSQIDDGDRVCYDTDGATDTTYAARVEHFIRLDPDNGGTNQTATVILRPVTDAGCTANEDQVGPTLDGKALTDTEMLTRIPPGVWCLDITNGSADEVRVLIGAH